MSNKAQTTVPQAVRPALHLQRGDELADTIGEGRVSLTHAERGAQGDPFTAFGEWDSDADHAAYAKL